MLLIYLCLVYFVSGAEIQETVVENVKQMTQELTTVKTNEGSFLPVTRPSISELAMKEVPPNSTEITTKKSTEFKASPQLSAYIEYNNFPVRPVWPEAKQVKTFQQLQNEIQPRPNPPVPFFPTKIQPSSTTSSPLKIDLNAPLRIEAEDKQSSSFYNKPVRLDTDSNPLKFYDKYSFGGTSPPIYPTDPPVQQIHGIDWSNSAFYNKPPPVGEHPYAFVAPVGHEEHEHKKEEYATPTSLSFEEEYDIAKPRRSPWKKIVKFLATVIPIGLLLSALTPSILTIGPPINTTQYCRKDGARIEDHLHLHVPTSHEITSFECSAKEVCESFLRGNTPDLQNIRNIVSQALSETTDRSLLDQILKAIHQKNCETIPCTNSATEQNETGRQKRTD